MEDKLDKNVKIIDEPIGMENQFKGMSQAMVNCLARHIDKDGSVLIIDPKKCTSNDDKQLIGLDMFQKDGVSVNGYVIAKSGSRHEPINLSDEQIKSIFDRARGIKMNCILATSSIEELENISDDVAKMIMSNTSTKVFLSIDKEEK